MEVSDGASTSKPTQTPPSLGLGCKVQERRPWCQPPTVAQGMRASTHQARAIGRMAVWPQHPMTLSMMTLHSLQISLAVCPPATKISLGMRMPHRLAAHHCKQPSLSVFSRRNSIRSPCYKFHLKSPPPGCCLPAGVFGSTKTPTQNSNFPSHQNHIEILNIANDPYMEY